ncbi:GNAT family N-acetyltransferase [Alicyclobacillus fodiniaquatilis]|uniref:GNAT family N-acetyltransferase n=1 Tax=Alicyclobacillus fodiniaquatilis TaxID=1661150 RepID=A0ABW4JEF6_9BACL
MGDIEITFEDTTKLQEYGKVPIAFTVHSILEVNQLRNGLGGLILEEVPVEKSYCVDFDSEKENGPERWLKRWDTENWGVIAAFDQKKRIGGAVIAYDTPGVNALEGRRDIAALWDIRVDYDYRSRGIGSAIFLKCIEWCRYRKCKLLKIECQNDNVRACKFYAKQGALLGEVNLYAYPDKPDISRLTWYSKL